MGNNMLKVSDLRPAEGAHKPVRRVGRGQGSGNGTTCGYGMNGAKARSGRKSKAYFEGGQTPLTRRLPKRGFTNRSRVPYQVINLGLLEKIELDVGEIDSEWLSKHGLIRSEAKPVKILGNGDFTKKVVIRANSFSKSAREKIEQAKGKAEVIDRA
jgi:large subunit ribosomal protein L15